MTAPRGDLEEYRPAHGLGLAGEGAAARYLIVDDIEEMRLTLRRMMKRGRDGTTVDLAASGREALEALRQARQAGLAYDAICIDLLMPGMGGLDVLRAVRDEALVDRHRTGLFVLSGMHEPNVIRAAKELGALDVLQKPISAADLVAVLRRWLEFRTRFAGSD